MSLAPGLDLGSRTVASSTPVRISVPSTDAPGGPFVGCRIGWRTRDVKMRPVETPDDDHELVIERVCAIDVAKASGKVCVRLRHPSRGGWRISRVWDVEATTGAVTELADHLVGIGIEKVTVESTSDYVRHEGA